MELSLNKTFRWPWLYFILEQNINDIKLIRKNYYEIIFLFPERSIYPAQEEIFDF